MRDLWPLAVRHFRGMLRTRAARVLALVYMLGLLAAIWLPGGGARVAGTIILACLVALSLLVFGVAAGIGNGLPADRRTGRHAWLLTTAPAPWTHRVALVLAGSVLTVAVGLAGGLAAGLTSSMWAGDFRVRDALVLSVPPPHARRKAHLPVAAAPGTAGEPWTLPLPAERVRGDALVELDIRPLFKRRHHSDYVDVVWTTDRGTRARVHASVWAPLRIHVPAGTRALTLQLSSTRVGIRVRGARLLTGAHSAAVALTWAGLLIGLMAAAATPIAVFVSRFTSGATAGGAAFVLLIYGAVKISLFEFLSAVPMHGGAAWAMGVLRGASHLAPDLNLLHVIGESMSGRMLDAGILQVVPPALLYLALGTVLVALPLPARWAERTLS